MEGESYPVLPEQTYADILSGPIKVYWGLAGEADRQRSWGNS